MLLEYTPDPAHEVDWGYIEVDTDGTFEEGPMCIVVGSTPFVTTGCPSGGPLWGPPFVTIGYPSGGSQSQEYHALP